MRGKIANAVSNVVDLEKVDPPPSDYELLRMRNVQRNNERLKELGLIPLLKPSIKKRSKDMKKDKKMSRVPEAEEPKRKSRRLLGQIPENHGLSLDDMDNVVTSTGGLQDGSEEREPIKLRQPLKMLLPQEVQQLPKNHTASYEHCLHRVRSMTHKQLANRIKMIERAAGQHAMIKMEVFQTCLRDERLDALADLAAEALKRLKGSYS